MVKCAPYVFTVVAYLFSLPLTYAQVDGWAVPHRQSQKSERIRPRTTPRYFRNMDPGNGGVQPLGAEAIPEDGKPEHQLPYTAEGLAKLKLTKPSNGSRTVLPGDSNDPAWHCDPQGFRRQDLYELRQTQIVQTPKKS